MVDLAAKHEAAEQLSLAFIDSVFAEKAFDCKLDRGTALAATILRYIVRERIVEDADDYLMFMRSMVLQSIELALELEEEREGKTCH
jgi:hypothetical protein